MSLRNTQAVYLASVFRTLREDTHPRVAPTVVTPSQSLHFYIYFTLRITRKHFRAGALWREVSSIAQPQATS